jgi:hypothetical protein
MKNLVLGGFLGWLVLLVSCGDLQEEATPTREGEVEVVVYDEQLIGVLVDTINCAIPEGCGERFKLRGQQLNLIDVTLTGRLLTDGFANSQRPEHGHVVRLGGVKNGPEFEVRVIDQLSEFPYDGLNSDFRTYLFDKYPCLDAGDGFARGNITYSWGIEGERTVLRTRLTNTHVPEPQPWVEVSYDGTTGDMLSEERVPDQDPCAG